MGIVDDQLLASKIEQSNTRLPEDGADVRRNGYEKIMQLVMYNRCSYGWSDRDSYNNATCYVQ